MNITSIVIPFNSHSEIGDRELLWALRSWARFFKSPYDVHILSDHTPDFSAHDINIEEKDFHVHYVPRQYPDELFKFYGKKHYERFIDVGNKLQYAINEPSISERFIWTYDDSLLCEELTVDDIEKPIALNEGMNLYRLREKKKWGRTINRSLSFARAYNSNTVYSYETHLPRVFEKNKWKKILKVTGNKLYRDAIPYALSTLYFNTYYSQPWGIITENHNPWKIGLYGNSGLGSFVPTTVEELEELTKEKWYINHRDKGLFWKDDNGNMPVYEYLIQKYG